MIRQPCLDSADPEGHVCGAQSGQSKAGGTQ